MRSTVLFLVPMQRELGLATRSADARLLSRAARLRSGRDRGRPLPGPGRIREERELDRVGVQRFVDWLTTRPGRDGRLCDRSISNALTPLLLSLDAAVAEGLLDANPAEQIVLPRRRAGRAWSPRERRYLTRASS